MNLDGNETLVLLGRSGSGKTTLLKMVNGLVTPSTGDVRFEDRRISDWDPIRLRRRIGYVIQDGGLFPHITVARNVGLVPELEAWPAEKIRRASTSPRRGRTRTGRLRGALSPAALGRREATCRHSTRARGRSRRCCCSTSRSPRSTR
jgi:ABC-type thiamine transport system ATPase subunit